MKERVSDQDQPVVRWQGETGTPGTDRVAVEEPLEIRLAGCPIVVTMRTPGHDLDLAVGFLYTEGIISSVADVASVAHCPTDSPQTAGNVVNVNPTDPALVDPPRWQRDFFASASCGICGQESIDAIRRHAPRLESSLRVAPSVLHRLEGRMRAAQSGFDDTGAVHAAGLFTPDGELLLLREDIGRHNAVDKVIGHAVRQGEDRPGRDRILLVSGRVSFEIVQKALMAGAPMVCAVSAPSSLAVELARQAGMTLVGFLRAGRYNVYAGAERLAAPQPV